MSDYEINKRLAELLGYKVQNQFMNESELTCQNPNKLVEIFHRDYCNNPADIMPLVIEHGISLNRFDCYWCASHDYKGVEEDASPYRAAAKCLIKTLESEQ